MDSVSWILLQSLGLGCRAPRAVIRSPRGRQRAARTTNEEKQAISNKVFVGNLSFDVSREELIEAFSAAGKVVDAKVPTDRETGRPRGFAFVEFEDDEAAAEVDLPHERQGPEGPAAARERGGEPSAASRRWRRSATVPSGAPFGAGRPFAPSLPRADGDVRRVRPRRPPLQDEGQPPQHPPPQARDSTRRPLTGATRGPAAANMRAG